MKARIKFRKYGALRFIGHLDVMRFFQKVMRRAEIPIAFTGGYSPHMIMSFASPLGIGLTSDGEYFDIELTEAIDSKTAVKRMNEVSIEGIEIISFRKIPDDKKQTGMTILAGADYLVSVRKGALPSDWKEQFSKFMSQPEIQVIKQTKRSERMVDIRALIDSWEIRDEQIYLLMETFLKYANISDDVRFFYHRLEMYADESGNGERKLIPLENLGEEICMNSKTDL